MARRSVFKLNSENNTSKGFGGSCWIQKNLEGCNGESERKRSGCLWIEFNKLVQSKLTINYTSHLDVIQSRMLGSSFKFQES